jgi:prepilin-type N-terminal cleavage/methylation domain-containing protein
MNRSRSQGFTLIEMVAVMVIMAIILSIAIPAVTNLSKANVMSAGAREVANTLSLARQFAITHRTYARVVFPYSGTLNNPDMWYHTYAVIRNADPANAGGWVYETKWEYLPVGVVFLNGNVLGSLHNLQQQANIPFPNNIPGNFGTLAYIQFGPTGAAFSAGALTINSGFLTSGGFPQPTTTNNYRNIFVDNIVGHVQVTSP